MKRAGESIGTEQFRGLTLVDGMRWGLAAVVIVAAGSTGLWVARDWTPPAVIPGLPEPAVLLDLVPLPPVPQAAPVDLPAEIAPPPEPVEPTPEPLPPEPVVESSDVTPPAVERSEPVAEPDPVVQEPEPVEPPPEHEPLPEPVPEVPQVVEPEVAMPATMSADLRQQRLETPPTTVRKPREEPSVEPAPTPQPASPKAAQQVQSPPPPAVASGPSPAEWQAQVLRHLDRRKVYPREAQRAAQEGVVQIAFTINASGSILSVSVARSSGIPALDQAALDTARRASPVPRPPASVGQGNIALSAAIRFTIR